MRVIKGTYDCLLSEEAFQKANRPIQIESQRASAPSFGIRKCRPYGPQLLLFL
jgi:hypothetical protein